jgi:hypothetical protein
MDQSESKLPIASGIIRQALTLEGRMRSLDEVYSDVTDVGDILSNLAELIRALHHDVAALPGIVEGLRVDLSFESSEGPQEIRDRAAARLLELSALLGPVAAGVRAVDQEIAALFIDDYRLED